MKSYCAVCARELVPAVCWLDGVPMPAGFHMCPLHPEAEALPSEELARHVAAARGIELTTGHYL